METTLTSKGQITLPKALRDDLHLKNGDKVAFEKTADGSYILRPRTLDVRMLKGCIKYNGPPKTLEEIQEGIIRGALGLDEE